MRPRKKAQGRPNVPIPKVPPERLDLAAHANREGCQKLDRIERQSRQTDHRLHVGKRRYLVGQRQAEENPMDAPR